MDLTIYDVIQGPVVTDKASELITKLHKAVFKVHPKANKPMIKQAVEKLFNVKVKNVRVIVRKGKKRIFKRKISVGSLTKRAIITLKPGYKFDIPGATGEAMQTESPAMV
jgi:large subunit ribosomal protein L23